MTRKEFIEELCIGLKNLPADEAQQTVLFYSEAIEDRIEEGMSEEDAVAAMGSVEDIVREICGTSYSAEEHKDREEPKAENSETAEYTAPADVRNVCIMRGFNVKARASHDDAIHLSTNNSEGFKAVMEPNGTLTVRRVGDEPIQGDFHKLRSVQDVLGFITDNITNTLKNFATIDLYMEIPENTDFNGTFNSGSDFSAKNITLKNINIKGSSGDVDLVDVNCDSLAITTSSGDSDLERIGCGTASIVSTSGDIEIRKLSADTSLQVHSTSGDIEVEASNAETTNFSSTSGDVSVTGTLSPCMMAGSTSGDIELEGVSIGEKLSVKTVSGDIEIRVITECRSVKLEAVSGKIDAMLTGDYRTSAHSVSGGCNIHSPNSDNAINILTANTVSGHIEVFCK